MSQCDFDFYTRVYNKIWKTKKARFNASTRFKKRSEAFRFAIFLLTIVQIILSLYLLTNPTGTKDFISFIALSSLSISILVSLISAQDIATKDTLDSERFHDCAKQMDMIYTELQGECDSSLEKRTLAAQQADEKYSQIKMQCPINHEKLDEDIVVYENPEDFQAKPTPKRVKERLLGFQYGLPILYIIISIAIVFFLFWIFDGPKFTGPTTEESSKNVQYIIPLLFLPIT